MNKVLHSSNSVMWETPQWLFDEYNRQYNFNTDVCAVPDNAKCDHFFTPEVDGLKQDWNGACWMNPPYGRNETGRWIEKAYNESKKGTTVVALIPARTDTCWFHQFIYNKTSVKITFLKGRLKFGGSKHGAPFPSMIVVFKQEGLL